MDDAAAMTQMNVRIPVQEKEWGSAALESIGFSPSQAVRALWHKAALRGKDLEEVRELLGGSQRDASADGDDVLEQGHGLWTRFMVQAGIVPKVSSPVDASYKQVLAEAFDAAYHRDEGDVDE